MTEEHKKKISAAHLGMKKPWAGKYPHKPLSEEHKRKIGLASRGRKISLETIQKRIAARRGWRPSEETRKKMSLAQSGKKRSEEFKKRLSESMKGKGYGAWMLGRKLPLETRIKMRNAQLKRVKEGNHPFYKGGVTPLNKLIRSSVQYANWRKKVFERDNYTCQECGQRGIELHADHIKPFAYFPELRLSIDNGRTLCVPCHRATDTYSNNAYKKYGTKVFWNNSSRENSSG